MRNDSTPLNPLVSPGRIPAGRLLLFLAVAIGTASCRDAPTDPMVGLVAEDAYAALALGVAFPDPGAWAPEDGLFGEGAQAMDRWRASWDLPAAEGQEVREKLYGVLAPALADHLGAEALEREVALLGEAALRAQFLTAEALPPHLASGVARAVGQAEEARAALLRGDPVEALTAVIRGGDALREVGPEAVARALQGEVEERLGRISEADPYTDQDLERLRRLVRGGRQAVDEGDWGLAIRRAFYAKGLLNGNG